MVLRGYRIGRGGYLVGLFDSVVYSLADKIEVIGYVSVVFGYPVNSFGRNSRKGLHPGEGYCAGECDAACGRACGGAAAAGN